MMIHEEVAKLALRNGLRMNGDGAVWGHLNYLCRFANKLLDIEREECARLLTANAKACAVDSTLRGVLEGAAAAIRARGNHG